MILLGVVSFCSGMLLGMMAVSFCVIAKEDDEDDQGNL